MGGVWCVGMENDGMYNGVGVGMGGGCGEWVWGMCVGEWVWGEPLWGETAKRCYLLPESLLQAVWGGCVCGGVCV